MGFLDPGEFGLLPAGEVFGVFPQRVAGALEVAGAAGGKAQDPAVVRASGPCQAGSKAPFPPPAGTRQVTLSTTAGPATLAVPRRRSRRHSKAAQAKPPTEPAGEASNDYLEFASAGERPAAVLAGEYAAVSTARSCGAP